MQKEYRHDSNFGCACAILLAIIGVIFGSIFADRTIYSVCSVSAALFMGYAIFQYVKGKGYPVAIQLILGLTGFCCFLLGGLIAYLLPDKNADEDLGSSGNQQRGNKVKGDGTNSAPTTVTIVASANVFDKLKSNPALVVALTVIVGSLITIIVITGILMYSGRSDYLTQSS